SALHAMQCNAVQCSAMQCNAVQCSAMQCNAVQCSAMQAFWGGCNACNAAMHAAINTRIAGMPHRYLVQFNPKQTPHFFTDILVIGAGIAGLRAALAVPRASDVLVVTKDKIQQSNSNYAQGGIAG